MFGKFPCVIVSILFQAIVQMCVFGTTLSHSPTYFCALLTAEIRPGYKEMRVRDCRPHFVITIISTLQSGSDPAAKDTDFLLHIIYHYCKQLIVLFV